MKIVEDNKKRPIWTVEMAFFYEGFLEYLRGFREKIAGMSYVEMKALSALLTAGLMEEFDFMWEMAQADKEDV